MLHVRRFFLMGCAAVVLLAPLLQAQESADGVPPALTIVPFGQKGLLELGPNGLQVVVPERNQAAAQQSNTMRGIVPFEQPGAATQQQQQQAGEAGEQPSVVCNCQCPPCPSVAAAQAPEAQAPEAAASGLPASDR